MISREGEGTTFCVFLPADSEARAPRVDAHRDVPVGNKRVLLMDDDALVRESAGGMLSSFGFDVTSVDSGDLAAIAYRDALSSGKPYDLCIIDLVVPGGMGGAACAKEILAIDPGAALFVSSGYSDDPVLAEYRAWGFRGIIPKPYTIEELRSALSAVDNGAGRA